MRLNRFSCFNSTSPMVAEIELLDASDSISTRSHASADSGCIVAAGSKTLRVLHVINGEHYAGAERVPGPARSAAAGIQHLRSFRLREAESVSVVATLPGRAAHVVADEVSFRSAPGVANGAAMIREQHFDLIHTHTHGRFSLAQLPRGSPECRWCTMCMDTPQSRLAVVGDCGWQRKLKVSVFLRRRP